MGKILFLGNIKKVFDNWTYNELLGNKDKSYEKLLKEQQSEVNIEDALGVFKPSPVFMKKLRQAKLSAQLADIEKERQQRALEKYRIFQDMGQGSLKTLNDIFNPGLSLNQLRVQAKGQQELTENNIKNLKDWALLQKSTLNSMRLQKSTSCDFFPQKKQIEIGGSQGIRRISSFLSLVQPNKNANSQFKHDIQLVKKFSLQDYLGDSSLNTQDDVAKLQLSTVAQNFMHRSKSALSSCKEAAFSTINNCSNNFTSLKRMIDEGLQQDEDLKQVKSKSQLFFPFLPSPIQDSNLFDNTDIRFLQDIDFSLKPLGPFQIEALRRQKRKQYLKSSSLEEDGRNIAIYTTASLPWMTGTSVNPLLRAAFLARDTTRKVSLVVPWLAVVDQLKVYPQGVTFASPDKQEEYVRDWIEKRTGFKGNFKMYFYPGKFAAEKQSILPVGDLTKYVPDHEADVAVLEEPEHLTWYHHGKRFTDKFNHVIGVIHTNYLDYARREDDGDLKASLLKRVNIWTTRGQCHKIIKLSDAVQQFPRSETMNIHGVSPQFLQVGEEISNELQQGHSYFTKGGYYIAKVLWSKGYRELLDIMGHHKQAFGKALNLDVYGMGNDLDAVKKEAQEKNLNLTFHGMKDHADNSINGYKVFINPCATDVVATTTAEALAMGKFVVCANHPSNKFFRQYPNCLVYHDQKEFLEQVTYALNNNPSPLTQAQRYHLTWEAATERFLKVGSIDQSEKKLGLPDFLCYATHNATAGFDVIRIMAGAGSNTRHTPKRVIDYQPCDNDVGGLLDNRERARKHQQKNKKQGHSQRQ